ncbi:hypothetical protein ACJX0J_012042 [Zea mays]
MLMHLMGVLKMKRLHHAGMDMWFMRCDLDELNIEKPQEWYTLTKEEKLKLCYFFNEINSKVLDIEALDNLQRELICGPHFLHYITEIPDQELLHKAHFLILQSAEDVSNFVIGFKSGVKTRVTTLMDTLSTQREAYKDDPFILANGAQGGKKNCCLDLIYLLSANVFPIFRIDVSYSLMNFASVYIVFFDAANANIVFEYIYVQWYIALGEKGKKSQNMNKKWAKEDAQLHPIIKKIVIAYVGLGMGLAQGDGPRKKKRRTMKEYVKRIVDEVAHLQNFGDMFTLGEAKNSFETTVHAKPQQGSL